MQEHGLGKKNIERLGFGTAQLARFHSKAEILRMLENALELGVTHFDTARAYGHGCMEGFCAPFFKKHRGKISLTSKAGLGHTNTCAGSEFGFVCRKALAKIKRAAYKRPLSSDELERSLHQSLRELQTEHLDFFLLHEHSWEEAERLLPSLLRFQRDGKIGRYGIASYYPALTAGKATFLPHCVLQSNLGTQACPLPLDFPEQMRITHSVYAGVTDHTRALEYALQQNPQGIVLVGTCSPKHLAEAVKTANAMQVGVCS